MPRALLVLFLGILITACEPDGVASGTKAIDGAWSKDEIVEFKVPRLDSVQPYDVFLTLRNNNDYPFNNIFLIVAMEFPHGKVVADTLEYRMAAPDGQWLGTGIGSVKESKLWYKENVRFTEDGDYILRISQAVRNNGQVQGVTELKGITDVGYQIEKASQ